MRSRSLGWVLTAAAIAACGGDDAADPDAATTDAAIDGAVDASAIDAPFVEPTMLSQTGLYSDIGTKTIAAGVIEYAPRWELWSDAAVKRRWIQLPAGSQIDTADMDFWSFPTGTKMWKEFSRGGRRIETRLLQKTGTGDDVASWYMIAFQWDQAESDAAAVPGGVVDDAGVNDIPARSACRQCHGPNRNPAIILGFQALQLDYEAANDGLDLGRLIAEDTLTVEPTGVASPYFPLPPAVGADVITPAVGYLHANCGGCHNARSDVAMNTVPVELRLSTAAAERTTWSATDTYRTAVNVTATLGTAGTHVVRGMDPAQSALFNRMSATTGIKMPPVARETVDDTAVTAVRTWINSLAPPP